MTEKRTKKLETLPKRMRRDLAHIVERRHWHSWTVGKLYLEDLIFIYEAMINYSIDGPQIPHQQRVKQATPQRLDAVADASAAAHQEESVLAAASEKSETPVLIEADGSVVNSIPELQALHLKDIRNFTMSVERGDLTVRCTRSGVVLRAEKGDEETALAFDQIRERIQMREAAVLQIWDKMLSHPFRTALAALALVGFTNVVTGTTDGFETIWAIYLWLLILFGVWGSLFWERRSKVVPDYRKNVAPPWYLSDEMKVSVVMAIVTAIISMLFRHLD